MKRWTIGILLLSVMTFLLGGCSLTKVKADDVVKPEYTVMKTDDFPEEVADLVEENKEKEFQMTYQDGEYLYLLKGYGKQETGGYSIQIADLSLWDNAIHLQTTLIGPDRDQEIKEEPSYPTIVIKMEYRDEPVIFE